MKILGSLLVCAFLLLPASAQAEDAKDEKKSALEYVDLNPLSIPVINETGLVQQVSIAVSLECATGKRDAVNVYKPRLMDAYLREVYGALGSGRALMHGNVVNVEELKTRLSAVTQRVVGPDLVSDVLLQSVHQYAMRPR